ncbi:MAG TPA: cupredoxin domain-containing protein [Candidatus Limnocylindrales bacterium]|nr:cupredoxin domain-containing protein [Candidatus Limnocylindrales bacterium]
MTAGARRPAILAAGVAVLALAIAGCGPATSAGADASPVATSTVVLPASYQFEPVSIAVPAGTTVTWSNEDHFTHSVQFLDGGLPSDPMLLQPGSATTFTFSEPGRYRYQCHLHPVDMQGTVVVEG